MAPAKLGPNIDAVVNNINNEIPPSNFSNVVTMAVIEEAN